MKPYLATLSARFRMLLQYRSAAFAGVITQLFFGTIRVMIFEAFYRTTPTGQPLTGEQTTTYIWLGQAFLLLVMMGADADLAGLIRSGNIAYELMRPVNLYGYWLSRMVASRAAPTIMRAGPILLIAVAIGQLMPPASAAHGLLFVMSITLGMLVASTLFALVTISLLWTISGEGISRLAPPLVFFFSGMIIPLPLFPAWAQPILAVLPFRGLIDVPFRIYLGDFPLREALLVMGQQIMWIVIFIVAGKLLLHRGLRRLVVQGG
jgi:ABC-2 type transport system permease protein